MGRRKTKETCTRGWSDRSEAVIRAGLLVIIKEEMIQDKLKDLGPGSTEAQAIVEVDNFLTSTSGEKFIKKELSEQYQDLQFDNMVTAFHKANPTWKSVLINLLAAAIGAFSGPWIIEVLRIWLKLTP